MPTFPVAELIAQNILTTVQSVTTTNGYAYNLTAQRHTKRADKRVHLNAIIVQEDPRDTGDDVYFTKQWVLPFGVGVFIIPTDTDSTPIDQYANVVFADVAKALMADRYRGGNAMETTITPWQLVEQEGSEGLIVVINVECQYRTNLVNPYQNVD